MYMESLPSHSSARELPFLGQTGLIENIESSTVRAFVRGVLPVEALKDTGLRSGSARSGSIEISAADIAAGIVTLRPHPAALSEWASFILLIQERFAYAPHEAACCERLLAGIWDTAFGAPLKDSVVHLALSVRARSA